MAATTEVTAWRPRRVHLFAPHNERAQRVHERLTRILETAGLTIIPAPEQPDDLVFSIGGDGTFLVAVRRFRDLNPVFCGVNTGRLGFLHEIDEENLVVAVDRLLKGEFDIETHPLLGITAINERGVERRYSAFNDMVVERRGTRTLHLTMSIDGYDLGPLIADGVLITTPGGSTAYALAAGGAILHPQSDVFQIIPLHPHVSRLHHSIDTPLVVPTSATVELTVAASEEREPRLVVDGDEAPFHPGERLVIGQDRQVVRILRLGLLSFWERLREKFLA